MCGGRGDAALANQKTAVNVSGYGVTEKTAPKTAGTFPDRAIILASQDEVESDIADFTEAIRLNPNDAAAYNNRGVAYFNQGDHDRAIADYEAALRIDPNYALARNNLERARQARGR
jgi:tetratricopeptide (TPR) repeat protein